MSDDLSDDMVKLITSVLDAVTVPHAATVAGDETRTRILNARVTLVKMTLETLMGSACPDVSDAMKDMEERLAEHPVIGFVSQKQAKRRLDAGATWSEAVSLDYRGPEVSFRVTAQRWARGWELHVENVGVTQSAPNKADAEAMARDFIARERTLPLDAFRVVIDTTEVDQ